MSTTTDAIRNVAVAGHGTTGKTTLVEHLLFAGGAIPKAETVESGRTTSDYFPDEVENGFSIHTTLTHLTWEGHKVNLLDTPGASDFVGEVVAAFRAAESAVVTVGAKSGVQIETIKLWRRLDNRNMPRLVFVTKMDEDRADFDHAMNDLGEKFDKTFVPVVIPMGSGADFTGVIDLLHMKAYMTPGDGKTEEAVGIPDEFKDAAAAARSALMEAAAEGDDDLLTKYLEEESLTDEEIFTGITEGLRANRIVPVAAGAPLRHSGLAAFLSLLATAAPSPAQITERVLKGDAEDGQAEEEEIEISGDGSFGALCFKTAIDQFSGKLSFIKVVKGSLNSDTDVFNAREKKKEKVGKIYTAQGKKLEEVSELVAGDIGILSKLASVNTNDSLCTPDNVVTFAPLHLPQPVHAVAIHGAERKDEDKLGDMLHRIVEEDLTFTVNFNEETKETVIAGMGELHLNMVLDKLKANKVNVETKVPKVAYRETITKSADAQYRHKKQSGGHGQFGEVVIQIRPLERGEFYQFENMIRGMAVSKGYVPGIEKGLHEAMEEGVVAGYPMVDIGIQLLDGKEHPVDSSEMAFKLAAKGAMKEAMQKAGPALLEPVMNLSVFIEEQYLGDVLSDMTSRRGRVQGQESIGGGFMEIRAQVPQAELMRYAIDLRSLTSGTGGFEMEFSHYEPISGRVADEVIKAAQAEKVEAS
ncbi:MAG: elongation factor G [Spirochaetaceae bacterium]